MDEQYAAPLRDVLAAYRQIARTLHAQALTTWLRLDLSLPQLKVLLLVADEETLYIGAVARYLGVSKAMASHLVDRLVRRGLIARNDDPVDRRRATLQLTARGTELMEQLYPGHAGDPSRHLPDLEVEALLALARGLQTLRAARGEP